MRYRLEIPLVSRVTAQAIPVLVGPASPSYSAQLEILSSMGDDVADPNAEFLESETSHNFISVADATNAAVAFSAGIVFDDINNELRDHVEYFDTQPTLDQMHILQNRIIAQTKYDQLEPGMASTVPEQEHSTKRKLAEFIFPSNIDHLNCLTPNSQETQFKAEEIGPKIVILISTDARFDSIRSRLLVHQNVFSELPHLNVQEIRNWLVQETGINLVTAHSCARAICDIF
jgi:hypothetical protein